MHGLFAMNRDQRLARNGLGHARGKRCAIDCQRMSGRHGAFSRDLHEQRSGAAHFFLQQPGRGVLGVGLQGIRADQFRKIPTLMRCGGAHRTHLEKVDGNAPARALPRRFRSRQSRADDLHLAH
jgi:hypothetical protein